MGTRREELEASIELTLQIAKSHAGELLPDVEYGEKLIRNAIRLADVCRVYHDLHPGEFPFLDKYLQVIDVPRLTRDEAKQMQSSAEAILSILTAGKSCQTPGG